ncbi:hypothetical protein [Luteolibacter sp. AS25]|uniref:hypothetical protein n=1 Tax=Luteolibacter sp. AS25 TaxID=3135776 RepID=UPI00398B9EC8
MTTPESIEKVRTGQKFIIYGILLNIAVIPLNLMSESQPLLGVIALISGLASLVLAVIGIIRMSAGLSYGVGFRLLFCALIIIPLIGLITMAVLNGKATKFLRDSGHKVGLLGARPLTSE